MRRKTLCRMVLLAALILVACNTQGKINFGEGSLVLPAGWKEATRSQTQDGATVICQKGKPAEENGATLSIRTTMQNAGSLGNIEMEQRAMHSDLMTQPRKEIGGQPCLAFKYAEKLSNVWQHTVYTICTFHGSRLCEFRFMYTVSSPVTQEEMESILDTVGFGL